MLFLIVALLLLVLMFWLYEATENDWFLVGLLICCWLLVTFGDSL